MTEQEYEQKQRQLDQRLGRKRKMPFWHWWLQRIRWEWYRLKQEARER